MVFSTVIRTVKGGEVGMNAVEVYEKAVHDLEHNKINLGQFEQRIKPLKDVEPTRIKAKWVRPVPGDGEPYCSNCKAEQIAHYSLINIYPIETPYCPYCGAFMKNYGEKHKTDSSGV